jgi:hypothetical protein
MYDITYLLRQKNVMSDLAFPRLVSYPRTGSHWLRILVEKYTGIPSAVQSFFDSNPQKIWGFHIHDRVVGHWEASEGPTRELKKVIYLYREPVDTIYSQMKYHKNLPAGWDGSNSPFIAQKVNEYIEEYYNHIKRWIFNNQDVSEILIVKYEDLVSKPEQTFEQVLHFLGFEWDEARFKEVYCFCDKQLTKKVTPHDENALNIEEITNQNSVRKQKDNFKILFSDKIRNRFSDVYEW